MPKSAFPAHGFYAGAASGPEELNATKKPLPRNWEEAF